MQKFVQELVWREFWQMTWIDKNINEDLRTKQKDYKNIGMPKKVNDFDTGINAIDNSINNFIVSNIQEMFSLIATLAKNSWTGQEKIELRIEDVINS